VLETGQTAVSVCLNLADLRVRLGDTTGAIRALERGLETAPGDSSVTAKLEALYRTLGDWARLADLFERDASSRESPDEAVARLRAAAALRRDPLHDAAAAAATLRRARSLAPGDLELLADYTDALRDAGDPATAVIEIGTALARGVSDPALHASLLVRRAALQGAAGKGDAALSDLEKAFALSTDVAAAPMLAHLEGRRAAAAMRHDEAAEGLAVLALASVAARKGDTAGAAQALERWIATHARDLAAWQALQHVHADAGAWSAAADVARRRITIEQGAGLVDAAVGLADACAQLDRHGDARAGLESVLRAAPREEVVRARLASLYESAGDHRALAALSLGAAETARDDSERFKLLLRAGETLLRGVGDAENSLDPLQRAWQLRPGDIEATVHLADALVLLRRLTEAESVLRQAVEAAKGRRSRDLAQVQHRLARIAQSSGDDRTALQWLVIALDSDFQNGLVASEVVDAAMALGEDEMALKALRALALMKNPQPMTRGVAFVRQGQIALKQGDKKKAVFFARKALGEDTHLVEAQELLKRAE
ncbi:MAG: tetratricopeptide repeat protein, partial [Deltaproteobacteria bacterium]